MRSTIMSAEKAGRAVFVAAALSILVSAAPLLADTISFTPASPNVERQVTFTYHPVKAPPALPIPGDFGDGRT
jgi:hypothetical protein